MDRRVLDRINATARVVRPMSGSYNATDQNFAWRSPEMTSFHEVLQKIMEERGMALPPGQQTRTSIRKKGSAA